MKKLFFFLVGLFMSIIGLSQPCLPDGITLNEQTQIDSFPINFPSCSEIAGDLIINGHNIKNLNGLNAVTFIGGQLAIVMNDSLQTLAGLENLVSVGKFVTIYDNPLLNSLTGLERLNTVNGSLRILMNNLLTNLSGLDSLRFIGGIMNISNSNGLNSLDGLGSLDSIGGDIGFWDNPVLSDLNGLNGLTSIGGEIYFSDNNALTTLKGLDNIDAASIELLIIINNSNLTTCAIQSICNFLTIPLSYTEIHDNAPGCNSEEEVDTACLSLSIDRNKNIEIFSIYPNPVSTNITIESAVLHPYSNLCLINLQGDELINFKIKEKKTDINLTDLPGGIYFLKITSSNSVNNFKIIKK
jgi:hypothetical protein